MKLWHQALTITTLSFTVSANAAVISQFSSLSDFETALDTHRDIDFRGMYTGTTITTNFSHLGIRFSGYYYPSVTYSSRFVTDGMGLSSRGDIHMQFTSPIDAIGFEYSGDHQIYLYSGSNLVGVSDFENPDAHPFIGVLGTSFDRAVLRNLSGGGVEFDNIHFGTATVVPIPSAIWLFGSGLLGVVGLARRKRIYKTISYKQ